jgi:hypothetical protein
MTIVAEASTSAWQPLTPRGAAAFARAPLARLLLVQLIFAALSGAVTIWFLQAKCFPVISQAIGQLPARGEIAAGRLDWAGDSPRVLAAGNFLSVAVDLNHAGVVRSPAQVQIEFGRESVWILSLFGYLERTYPAGWSLAFNQPELEPKWGAWRAPLLWLAMGAVTGGLMVIWALLATAYCLPVWLAGVCANRELSLGAGWKMAGAALLPGALLMMAGLGLYGSGAFGQVELLAVAIAHMITGWIFLFAGLFFAPRLSGEATAKGNPFASGAEAAPPADGDRSP